MSDHRLFPEDHHTTPDPLQLSSEHVVFGGFPFLISTLTSSSAHQWWLREVSSQHWEASLVSLVTDSVQPGDVFFDVGAWIGPYTLLASRLVCSGGQVYAFEPDPIARYLLQKNIVVNECDNVHVIATAVSNTTGPLFLMPRPRYGDSNTKITGVPSADSTQVDGISLDEFCLGHAITPDVIKIDVEGAEHRVLSGAGYVLDAARAIFVEVHHTFLAAAGITLADCISTVTRVTRKHLAIIEENSFTTLIAFCR